MGFGDKFKDLAKQAQDAVVEHKDQIHNVVDTVGSAADRRTRGKYTDKIAKVGQKAGAAVDKLAEKGDGTAAAAGDTAPAPAAQTPTAPAAEAPPTAPAAEAPPAAPGETPPP